jgi:hypothetical protein
MGVWAGGFLFSHSSFWLDFWLFCVYNYSQMNIKPKGEQAARLRQRKFRALERLELPPDALPGSLALTHRRCGKANCHCAKGQGHPVWTLTFMVEGEKRVERIPDDWVEEVRKQLEAGRRFKQAIGEVLAANAQLLALWRKQRQR